MSRMPVCIQVCECVYVTKRDLPTELSAEGAKPKYVNFTQNNLTYSMNVPILRKLQKF